MDRRNYGNRIRKIQKFWFPDFFRQRYRRSGQSGAWAGCPVNSSFFGGLFEGSLKKMNKEEFLQKFRFVYNTGESLNPDLWENIEDDIQYVINNL